METKRETAPADLTIDPQRATPDGQPDKRDRDKWLLLALISPGDIDAAEALWKDHAPPALAGMLTGDGWTWDAETQTYVSRHNQKMNGDDLKKLAILFALAVSGDLRSDASEMAMGLKPLEIWQQHTADTVKDLYVCEAAIAAGGFANLSPEILDKVTGTPDAPPGLAFSLDRLRQFAQDAADGKPGTNTEAAIINRASLYGDAGQGVYETVRVASHNAATDEAGRPHYLFYRRILGDAQHCRDSEYAEGCPSVAAAGWQEIGTLPEIGTCTCGPNCACSWEFSLTGGLAATP